MNRIPNCKSVNAKGLKSKKKKQITSVVLVASQRGAQLEQEMSIGKLLSPFQRTGKVETSGKHTWLFKLTKYYCINY